MKRFIIFSIVALAAFASTPSYPAEKSHVGESTEPNLKTQFFCGYCHILTYPNVIKKSYYSWKDSKHKDVPCVQCHYPPERMYVKIPGHKKIPATEDLALEMKELEFMRIELEVFLRLVTVLNMEDSMVLRKPKIDDRNCTASKCHPTTGTGKEVEYWTKKITFTEYVRGDKSKGIVSYVHKTHFDKEKLIEGQEMHCSTCHQHETGQRHFEVSKEKCFLCHFKDFALNEKRAKCSLCHEVPTKSLQKKQPEPGAKLITHQTIEKDKVPCYSCHMDMVKGRGVIKEEKCLTCHENEKPITKETTNKKLMHEKHVAGQNANCFECHEAIQHKKADFLEAGRETCTVCHPEHHISQKMLLVGAERKNVSQTPSLMLDVRTGCLGCHMEERIVKGEKVLHGDPKACAQCHVEKTAQMVKEWKDSVEKALKEAKELEKEAKEAIEKAKGKVPDEKLKEAVAMVKEAQQNVQLVEAGGGAHNQKYSILILDAAMGNFEEAIDLLH